MTSSRIGVACGAAIQLDPLDTLGIKIDIYTLLYIR